MPRIFDNIELHLLPALQNTLKISERADFCVGYFNLRGWRDLDTFVERWSGDEGACCRLMIGMQSLPEDELRDALRISKNKEDRWIDLGTAFRLKKRMAEEFRAQLTIGAPTNADETGLRRLSTQLRAKKVSVKLFLRHKLHAKLYLLYRTDPNNPITGFIGSSNLTFSGLQGQGELNVDVVEGDAAHKLANWFEDRWQDRWCLDISEELADIIDSSWAREIILKPYYIYLKMAYHLSHEARAGLSEFQIPSDFGNQLFEFQKAAVQIAAHHVNKRGGVLIGDVVGLGKTLMATTLARIFQDDFSWETLIICPKNLEHMWQDYKARYRLIADIIPISQVERRLPELRRYRLVLIDESHNLRNREGKRYHAIQKYIEKNDSRCILLTATPYNKTYLDLSAQLRLFIPEDKDLGIRPEHLMHDISEVEFVRRHQCGSRTLAAFEKSEFTDDWRELMRLFMVRRTRSFIQDNYAQRDPIDQRRYLTFADGTRSYFPKRVPLTIGFTINDGDKDDPYARLYSDNIVNAINFLHLPRYGMGNYVATRPKTPPTPAEAKLLNGLSRSGKRLMGFCRTNLFKRLESGGPAFIQSIERHALRNFVYVYALENGLDIPLGTQESELIDPRSSDSDADAPTPLFSLDGDEDATTSPEQLPAPLSSEAVYRQRAAAIYQSYITTYKNRFRWLSTSLFIKDLKKHLLEDAKALLHILDQCGTWDADRDTKLAALQRVLTQNHPTEKVLVFTQFADTAHYLQSQLQARGVAALTAVTGDSADPTELAWRFSPQSNDKRIAVNHELRVLIATDVLSEGQNLQDCATIINYDIPWAIIRLIQRAGRVDRIGQRASEIRCYSFLPADGVERIIRLHARVRQRLHENAEVVGTDESFFEDEVNDQPIFDIYNEKANIFDSDGDGEVDLASYAYQIWKNATDANPALLNEIPALPQVVYSSREHIPTLTQPEGVILYLRNTEGNDALAWIDDNGALITQSQYTILNAAACSFDTPGLPRDLRHHDLVEQGVKLLNDDERKVGGQLGRPSGARFRVYDRLHQHALSLNGTLWESNELERVVDVIYRFPLRQSAVDILNRQLRAGISIDNLAALVLALHDDDRLCIIQDDAVDRDPQIICSLGLFAPTITLE